MPQFLEGGPAMYDALAYARPHQNTVQFLQQHAQNFYQNLTDAGRQFTTAAISFYDSIGMSYGSDYLRALGRQVEGMWQVDAIRPLHTLEDFQQASPIQQRFIMANPALRTLYHQQQVDGYSHRYVDYFPKAVGDDHYDYRRATSGIVQEDPEGNWKVRTYFEELILPEEQHLLPVEKVDIWRNWQKLEGFLLQPNVDPSSVYGDERA